MRYRRKKRCSDGVSEASSPETSSQAKHEKLNAGQALSALQLSVWKSTTKQKGGRREGERGRIWNYGKNE